MVAPVTNSSFSYADQLRGLAAKVTANSNSVSNAAKINTNNISVDNDASTTDDITSLSPDAQKVLRTLEGANSISNAISELLGSSTPENDNTISKLLGGNSSGSEVGELLGSSLASDPFSKTILLQTQNLLNAANDKLKAANSDLTTTDVTDSAPVVNDVVSKAIKAYQAYQTQVNSSATNNIVDEVA